MTVTDISTNGGGDGDIDNTVTADSTESGTDTADETVLILQAQLEVTKVADVASVDAAGDVINYTVTVDNTGNISLTNVTVDDTLLGEGGLTYQSGDTDSDGELDVTETWTYTGQYIVTQADMDAGTTLHNVVTADSDESVEDTAFDDVTITQTPLLEVTKVADVASVDAAGDVINYTVTVDNTGNIADERDGG